MGTSFTTTMEDQGELLEFQPSEKLEFIFEPEKQIYSCNVRLSNNSDHHVAFKVQTNAPEMYCSRPNIGVMEPKSTCDVELTRRASEELMSIKPEKFLFQSMALSAHDEHVITPTMFSKDKLIEEKKLRVILIEKRDLVEVDSRSDVEDLEDLWLSSEHEWVILNSNG